MITLCDAASLVLEQQKGSGMKSPLPCCLQTVPDTPAEAVNTGQARPTGKVVGIIRRNWRTHGYCGSLQPPRDGRGGMQTQTVLFCPVERRYPMIRLQTRQVQLPVLGIS